MATTKKTTPAMRVTFARGQTGVVCAVSAAVDGTGQTLTVGVLHQGKGKDGDRDDEQDNAADDFIDCHG